ncbi:MAG: hypothetical protein IPM00_18695 [Tetrasphaera sp.]|nr:hypothetical protein [Tetrasphaera sp.]
MSGERPRGDEKVSARAYRRKIRTYRQPSVRGADPDEGVATQRGRERGTKSQTKAPARTPAKGAPQEPSERSRVRQRNWLIAALLAVALMGGGLLVKTQLVDAPLEPTTIATSDGGPQPAIGPTAPRELRSRVDQTFGTFDAVTWSGSGNQTLTVPEAITGAVVRTRGTPGTTWEAFNSDDERVDYTWSSSDDSKDVLISRRGPVAALKVEADDAEAWTLELWPLSVLPELPAEGGVGDDSRSPQCFLYGGAGGRAELSYEGEDYASFDEYTMSDKTSLLGEIGTIVATRALRPGPSVLCVEVHAGRWRISAPQ